MIQGNTVRWQPRDHEDCRLAIQCICEGLVLANLAWIERYGLLPEGHYHYERERLDVNGKQHVGHMSEIALRKAATCMDWACYRAAEMRSRGIDCWVDIAEVARDPKRVKYHATVAERLPTGQVVLHDVIEDLDGGDRFTAVAQTGACCTSCSLGHECAGDSACAEGAGH